MFFFFNSQDLLNMCISNPAFNVSKTHITCLRIERGVQVYLNEGVRLFPIVDNSDIVKLYQRVFFPSMSK